MSGIKYDDEKNKLQLIPFLALERIANIFTFGAKKYGEYNWTGGITYSRIYGALLRHLFAWIRGENLDPETGMSHLHHCGACIMMLIEMEEFRKDLDDRPKYYKNENEKR
jgi:hypothetical protein